MFIGILDPGNNTFDYINAGHNPPLLCRGEGAPEHLHGTGIMMGAFDGVTWEMRRVEMGAGESLIVYTDGVTEAEREREFFGEGRLEKAVAGCGRKTSSQIVDDIKSAVTSFIQETPPGDDITLLVLKHQI